MTLINNKTIIIFLTLILFNANYASGKPYIPVSGSEVLILLDKTSQRSRFQDLNKKLERNKNNPEILINLLQETINFGKTNTDPRYIGFATSYIESYSRTHSNNSSFKIIKAQLLQHDHQFDKAVKLLNSIIKEEPLNTAALLLRSSVLQVQAKYNKARKDCLLLLGKTSHLVTVSCIAQVDGLTRNTKRNYETLQNIINSSNNSIKELRWSYEILAQLALQLGNNGQAGKHYIQGLEIAPNNTSLLNSYSDLLLSEHKYQKVLKLLKYQDNDFTSLLRLTIAEKYSSNNTRYKKQFLTRLNQMRVLSDLTHQREIAAYYLIVENNGIKAIEYAQQNWAVQKELYDAQLLLKSAYKNQNSNSASSVIKWYQDNSISDIRIKKLIQNIKELSNKNDMVKS